MHCELKVSICHLGNKSNDAKWKNYQ